MEYKICLVIVCCLGLIDKYELRASVVIYQACGGIYDKRSSAYDQHIRLANVLRRACPDLIIEAFFVKDYVGLDQTAAFVALGKPKGLASISSFTSSPVNIL